MDEQTRLPILIDAGCTEVAIPAYSVTIETIVKFPACGQDRAMITTQSMTTKESVRLLSGKAKVRPCMGRHSLRPTPRRQTPPERRTELPNEKVTQNRPAV